MYGHAAGLLSSCWCGKPATIISDVRGRKVCAGCALREETKAADLQDQVDRVAQAVSVRPADALMRLRQVEAELTGTALAADPWRLAASA